MPEHTPPTLNWSKKKLRLVKLAMLFVALLVGLFIAEIALRVVGYTYPIFYTTDTVRGYALQPGVSGWYRKEGEAYVEINSDGLRDREHAKAKPVGTIRIAVLGDSYAEALQVPLEDAFWVVMQQRLQTCPAFAGRRVEVINFGVSGYGTAQELLTLRQKVWDYAPDIVLLALTTNNDITDNLRALKRTDEIPYFVYRDGQLALDNSFLQTRSFRLRHSALNRAGRWIRDHLRVIQAFHQGHYALKNYLASKRAPAAALPLPAFISPSAHAQTANADAKTVNANTPARTANAPTAVVSDELGIDNLIYREPADDTWREAWRVTEGLLALMHDEVGARGAKFVVATLSNGVQVHPQPAAREAFLRRVGANDILYPDARIRSLGEREGFAVITLAPHLQHYAEQHQAFLHGFGRDIGNGHWNALGHRVAGELLAQKMCEVFGKQ
ncbi:MAG TPA: SGNH/GDSL hydrolase family protein [Pyrinomonadaceae bacterium]|nr:SGNH/GDSL hydrolase family protein [Pyrinomonadaceae bacterium]